MPLHRLHHHLDNRTTMKTMTMNRETMKNDAKREKHGDFNQTPIDR